MNNDSPRSLEEIRVLYDDVNTQCEELRRDVATLLADNQMFQSQVSKLEALLTKRNFEVSELKGKINIAETTFNRLNKRHFYFE